MKRFFLVLILGILLVPSYSVRALNGSGFNPGRIIDDGIFYNAGSMTPEQIQLFLNSKVPVCDTNGSKASEFGGGTRAQYGSAHGQPPPYTCVKDYYENTSTNENNLQGRPVPAGAKSAAQIIFESAQRYSVNPQVLITIIQREQNLITDDWPFPSPQYASAAGYMCPDTGPNHSVQCQGYYGFYNQVESAAWQIRHYANVPNNFNYLPGRNNNIAWSPQPSCGTSSVYIENQATASLYDYAPYRPNQAALNNLYGTGDACSSYANRNFWRVFNDWFGPTTSDSDADVLSFVKLNHSSGNVEDVGYTSISSYSVGGRGGLTTYPSVPADGAVRPILWPNGDLVFIRLNHSSGHVEVVSYSKNSNFRQMANYQLANYPSVATDGSVIPLFKPNGDLSFIRLNHSSGHIEIVSYSAASGFKQMNDYRLANYPSVAADGAVKPLYWPNGDLVFIRLNHSSGHVELVSYSAASGFQQMVNYRLTSYPSVAADGAVVPLFKPNGDLSFIRLNHSSGHVEIVTYSAASGFQTMVDYKLSNYPSAPIDGSVVPLYSR